jgi:predicted secreted protein
VLPFGIKCRRGVKKLNKKNHNNKGFEVLMFAILVSFVFSVAVCPCASAASMWSKTYGGTGDDTARGETVQTSDGGYAILGETKSFGAGGSDFWLFKTDADGVMQWNKTYGGALDEVSGDMYQTTDGGYALAGATYSFGAGGEDFWLVKTGADGVAYWAKTYGGTSDEHAYVVVQTSDGGYALAGYTDSFGAGNRDFYLVKTDADGNMEWSKTYGGTDMDFAYTMIRTSDGGYALAGYTDSFGAGGNDTWLVKTDASGNMQWNKTYGGTGNDGAIDIIESSAGGYVLTGYTGSFGGVFLVYLVKTDTSGNIQLEAAYGATFLEVGIHVIQTVDGGYAMAGYNYANGQDFILIKTDADGTLEWETTYGGTGFETAYALLQASDGGYVLTGSTSSYGAGSNDIWLLKTDELGVVPEYSSLLIPALVLIATAFLIVNKKRLLRAR